MERGFKFDEQALEAAEYHRNHGQPKEALEITSTAFGFPDRPLTTGEVSVISHDWEQRPILACLAGIHVESSQNLSMMSGTPWNALSHLEKASWAICTIYRNPVFKSMIGDVREDYWDRQYFFKAEIAREIARTLVTAAPLYHPEMATKLTNLAVDELQRAYMNIDSSLGVGPLISMERQILEAKRGKELDFSELLTSFNRLAYLDQEKDPECVATAASQLIAWGEKMGSQEAQKRGLAVFGEIAHRHPELDFILEAEREDLNWEIKREARTRRFARLAWLLSPWNHYSTRCQKLYDDLKNEDYYMDSFRGRI